MPGWDDNHLGRVDERNRDMHLIKHNRLPICLHAMGRHKFLRRHPCIAGITLHGTLCNRMPISSNDAIYERIFLRDERGT